MSLLCAISRILQTVYKLGIYITEQSFILNMRAELVAYARLQIVVTSLIGCNIHCNTVVVFSS